VVCDNKIASEGQECRQQVCFARQQVSFASTWGPFWSKRDLSTGSLFVLSRGFFWVDLFWLSSRALFASTLGLFCLYIRSLLPFTLGLHTSGHLKGLTTPPIKVSFASTLGLFWHVYIRQVTLKCLLTPPSSLSPLSPLRCVCVCGCGCGCEYAGGSHKWY
jgi:hypothetical protein